MLFQKLEALLTIVGRAVVLAVLLVGAWTFGVANAETALGITMACLSLIFISMSVIVLRRHQQRLSVGLPIAAFLLLALAAFQSLDFAKWGVDRFAVSSGFATETIEHLDAGLAKSHPDSRFTAGSRLTPETTISQLPSLTRHSTGTLACAVILLVASAIVFDSSRSRKVFAVAVVFNALALVAWGFVQRSGGDAFLLPGIERTGAGTPFASFIYKNAGAAALFPAFAILISRLFFRDRVTHQDFYGERSTYRASADFLEIGNLIIASCLLFLAGGLAVTYCRGAWAAIGVATAVAIAMNCRFRFTRSGVGLSFASAGLVAGLVWLLGVGRGTGDRIQELSITRVASDSRWSHWPDGWNLAMAEFPFGSGLGTYRYASLPHQESVHGSWYQYAHNQYLETFAEVGLFGILLVLFAIGWMLWHANRLRQYGETREDRRWGMVAMLVVVAGMLHSCIDFVLILPPNLFLFAAFVGTTLSVPLRHGALRHGTRAPSNERRYGSIRFQAVATFLLLAGLTPFGIMAYQQSERTRQIRLALHSTPLPDGRPQDRVISSSLSSLDEAIVKYPRDADLFRRRFKWHLAAMRSSLIELGAESDDEESGPRGSGLSSSGLSSSGSSGSGQSLSWRQTHPASLFVALESADPRARTELRNQLWASPSFSKHAALAITDLRNSLVCLPLNPHFQLSAVYFAPLIDVPAAPAIRSTMTMSNNSHDLLFRVGVSAIMTGDVERATECWHHSLLINSEHAESIYQIAASRVPAPLVVGKLIPAKRLYTIMRLVPVPTDHDPSSQNTDGQHENEANEVVEGMIQALHLRNDIAVSIKHALTAQIRIKSGDSEAALAAWGDAVHADRKNPDYRYEYALALHHARRTREALDQARLGAAISIGSDLGSDEERFDRLIKNLRIQISRGYSATQMNPLRMH